MMWVLYSCLLSIPLVFFAWLWINYSQPHQEPESIVENRKPFNQQQLDDEVARLREELEQVKEQKRAEEFRELVRLEKQRLIQQLKEEAARIEREARIAEEIRLKEEIKIRDRQAAVDELRLRVHQTSNREVVNNDEAIRQLTEQLRLQEERICLFKRITDQSKALDIQLDLDKPDWAAKTWTNSTNWQNFTMYEYSLASVNSSDRLHETPVHVAKTTTIELRVKSRPFARGGFRFAFYAQRKQDSQRLVLKKLQTSTSALKEIEKTVRMQLLAQCCQSSFARQASDQCQDAKYVPIYVVKPCADEGDHIWSIEPLLPSTFEKFNSNDGTASEVHETPQALSHFSFHFFRKKMVLVDVQGCKLDGKYMLTDPAFHSIEEGFGDSDCGKLGITKFFQSHKCNRICDHLRLKM